MKIDRLVWFTVAIWVAYAVVTLTAPLGSNVLELTAGQMFWIRLTIALPYLFVWVAGVWATAALADYAQKISSNADGKALLWIARGLFVLIASLLIPALVGLARSRWPEIASIQAPIQVFNNYVYSILPLLGFALIWWGARKMSAIGSGAISATKHIFPVLVITGLVAAVFVIGVYTNPDRQMVVSPNIEYPSYVISDWAIGLTLVLPSIIGWFVGLVAAALIGRFHRETKAPLYRNGLSPLVRGFYLAIVGTMFLNLLLSLGSFRLVEIGLGPLLALIYIWLALLAVGYGLIALGVRRLTAIESVKLDE